MKLLFITQKVDVTDDVLGFIHGWLLELAKRVEFITVICLYEGTHDLPSNVKVLSLGKEGGVSRFKYVSRFYKYIFSERKNYDSVFVHMNAEYVILGALFWKLWGKKFAIWYNHTFGNWQGRLAFMLAPIIFHTSPYAFSAGRTKSNRMPAGVNTDHFVANPLIQAPQNSILYVGRLSKVKKVHVLLDAAKILKQKNIPFVLNLYGSPDKKDLSYYEELKKQAEGLAQFKGSVANIKMPEIYNQHEVFVNLTPAGNYDKTVLEAPSCEKLVLVSSPAFKDLLPEELFFKEDDAQSLAERLEYVFGLSPEQKKTLGKSLRQKMIDRHDLKVLAARIVTFLE